VSFSPCGLVLGLRARAAETGLNLYDVRLKCDRSKDADGPLCYKQLGWIETWMNDAKNKAALGANPSRTFESCNMETNQAFMYQGDGMHNSALLLPELIGDGVRLLVYAGNAGGCVGTLQTTSLLNAHYCRFSRHDV
jgi:Serine carboxypeptidase